MKMLNEIVVNAPPMRIFQYAGATERWPELLPHYRFVRVLEDDGRRRVVEMAARRGAIPVRWRAEQINDPATPRITFRHVSGWTKGMEVVWHFEPVEAGTKVSIEHVLQSPIAPIAAKYFIDPIASRTLACMKRIAESGS